MKGKNNAWLKPSGQIVFDHPRFYYERSWHLEMAMLMLEELWKTDFMGVMDKMRKEYGYRNAIEILEDLGWIRLHGFGGITPVWIVMNQSKLTKKQEETILDWCIANNRDYDTCFAK